MKKTAQIQFTFLKTHIRNCALYLLFSILYFLLPSCNPTKRLTEGEFLLKKNIIIDKSSGIDKSEIESYIKQKPNRKMLFWRLYLNIYNTVNQEKMERKKEKHDIRVDSVNAKRTRRNIFVNAKREAAGKNPQKVVLKKKEKLTRREWLLSIGEPPVIYDSLLAQKSVKQIKLFVNNKGFFNSVVKDSVKIINKKAVVSYIIKPGQPYRIRNLIYEIKDYQLYYFVLSEASNALIKRGENYDLDVLEKERDRITTMLRNLGYFFFAKDYIYFEVDSSLGSHEVNITLGIKNPVVKIAGEKDSVAESTHKRYTLDNIFVLTDYNSQLKLAPTDTLFVNDYYLLSTGKLRYKQKLLTDAVFLSKGDLYQQKNYELTYRRLSELKLFRTVQLQFVDIGNNLLECHIYLSNVPKQSFSAEAGGINTSETKGIEGNLTYQNKNSFKGGEIFEVKVKGSLEVQKTLNGKTNNVLTGGDPFNTRELGAQINLSVPRFLTPFGIKGRKSNNAKTNFMSSYNYQNRPDYFERYISNLSYGYSWTESATKKHIINPIEFSFVDIFNVSPVLATAMNNSIFLRNSYSPHFTIGTRYAFIFSNQNIRKQQSFSFLRIGAEGAGNAMRGLFNLFDKYKDTIQQREKDTTIIPFSYTIKNIRFSQYVRFDIDYRYYKLLNEKDKLAYRFVLGMGKPFVNLRELPLEKSFFAGGSNDIRAWQARTLGPGNYQEPFTYTPNDKIGDIKIEGNIEYRFHIIKMLNAALFVDAGNIWLRKKFDSYPKGEFHFLGTDSTTSFIDQIAIGTGIGLRLDFNFFIIRLDGAIKFRDPSLPPFFQWGFDKRALRNGVLNFGIGYPF